MTDRKLELYLHIPFCARKCYYCDFLSMPRNIEVQHQYFLKLREEIKAFPHPEEYSVISVFFGGGTPSLSPAREIVQTLETVRECFHVEKDAEITIECNPGTLGPEHSDGSSQEPAIEGCGSAADKGSGRGKLREYRGAGINRISFGVQSADNSILKSLGRIHTWEKFVREYADARREGFENISVDLMYSLPGQTPEIWADTIEKVLSLPAPPEHISAYSLIIEKGTLYWERYHEDAEARARGDRPLFLPDEDSEDRMEDILKKKLTAAGYHRYEISNYAKNGFQACGRSWESLHNKGYWERREYAGFGLGSSSLIGHTRYRNCEDLDAYLKDRSVRREETVLTRRDEISETMFLGLRETRGVDMDLFRKKFGEEITSIYADTIRLFLKQGLLETDGAYLRLTERGIRISNLVMSEFLLD